MGNNHKGKMKVVPQQFTTEAARLTITAYTDRPPTMECTSNLVDALRLIAIAAQTLSNIVEKGNKPPAEAQADQVDKKREYLGPRKG
jgi:hypothetical protein